MDGYLVFLLAVATMLIGIGLLVIAKNARSSLHRSFFLSTLFLPLWIVANFLSNDQSIATTHVRIANHLVLATSGMGLAYLLRYAAVSDSKSLAYKYRNLATVFNIVVALLCLTPLVVEGISRQGNVYAIAFGPLANLYFATVLINAAWAFITLIRSYRRSVGIERSRYTVILLSFALTVVS